MLTLYDYLPSQNGYKIRLLLNQLERPFRTEIVSIFEGQGQRPEYLAINPTGAVPAIRLEDGRVLAESNAILFHLAEGSRYLPADAFQRAKVLQWMSFEADYIQATAGSLTILDAHRQAGSPTSGDDRSKAAGRLEGTCGPGSRAGATSLHRG